jgi:hypothetical protein
MNDLTELLGQGSIIDSILEKFNEKPIESKVVLLRGDSGTGKSFIAKRLMKEWNETNNEKKSLLFEGDISQKERAFYPMNIGLIKAKEDLLKIGIIKKGASELVKGLPFAGDFVSFLLDRLTEKKSYKEKNKLSFMRPEEHEILLSMNSFYRGSELLLIADNFHWWDESSIDLLKLLLTRKINEVFSFLKRLKVLVVVTDDQIKLPDQSLEEFLKTYEVTTIYTHKIKRDDFKKVLSYFEITKLGSQKENLIYCLTNGHLEIIKNLTQFAASEDLNARDFNIYDKNQNANEAYQQFLEKTFALRLQQLGADAEQIINLLEYASIIGLHFNFEEVLCLTKEKEEKLKYIIEKAKEGNLLKNDSIQTSFSHDIIREFFLCRIKNKKSLYYKSFAHCLAILRPAAYFQRANLLFEAGDIKESLNVYILGYLKCIRDGYIIPHQVKSRIDEFGKNLDVIKFFYSIREAYSYFYDGLYDKAKGIIIEIEDIYPEILLAEKYYLLSLCLPKNLNKQDLIESRNCIQNWESLKNTESELWVRIMLTLISRHAHLNEYDTASAIERKVMVFLSERIHFDPFAEYGINVLRRKASILHISEIACKRTETSLKYFGKSEVADICSYPLQYYMALANHSGNLTAYGEFDDGYSFAQHAVLFKNSYPEISFPRIEVPINNLIISGYLSHKMPASQCLQLYESLFSNLEYVEGRILLRNNYIILKALNGELDNALTLIDQLHNLLTSTTREDNYYEYFVGINRFVIHFLNGKKNTAKKIIEELQHKIPQIPDKHFLQRRHEILEAIYRKSKISDPLEWNNCLFEKYPQELGQSWRFFGNGFLFTDMQFWSDS